MLVLELRWVIFGLCALLVLAVWFAMWPMGRASRLAGSRWTSTGAHTAALDHAPFGWLIMQDDRRYRYANLTSRRLLRLDGPFGDLPDEGWQALLAEDRQAARDPDDSERDGDGRFRIVALAPDRVVAWWVAPNVDGDLVYLTDVSAQQRSEEAARILLSDISHELRTPLATLLTHLEVLHLPQIGESAREQSLTLLRQEGERMARLINDMLELGRLETSVALPRGPLDLLDLAQEAVAQMCASAAGRDIQLSLQASAPLDLVAGNRDRLKQVFLNLLDNAIKFGRAGDSVVIAISQANGEIHCAVRDSGPGIPQQHLAYVTRRFYRVNGQDQIGSGLGLALAAEILRHHGSRLEIESCTQPGQSGTTVNFTLPVLPEAEEAL